MTYAIEHKGRAFTPEGETSPQDVNARNRATSAREVADFKARKADRWFAYFQPLKPQEGYYGFAPTIRNWMGEVLARVEWQGSDYQCPAFGHPSTRRNFRARGIDSRMWAGTYYVSSGDYVRMRVVKGD